MMLPFGWKPLEDRETVEFWSDLAFSSRCARVFGFPFVSFSANLKYERIGFFPYAAFYFRGEFHDLAINFFQPLIPHRLFFGYYIIMEKPSELRCTAALFDSTFHFLLALIMLLNKLQPN